MSRILTAALVAALAACSVSANSTKPPMTSVGPGATKAGKPQYAWRGIHLDVARHYFDLPTLKKLVDLEAHFHLNMLHLHFTDDGAWRLPSRRYPRVIAAQYYTESELRDLVAYAKQRYVTIVPEMDLPGHSGAVLRAYPELACGSSNELCPAAADVFADNEIAELLRMFPSPWIHLGGDEVTTWSKQQRRHFETHIAETLEKAQRKPVVWDDEADVAPPTAVVMVWHLGDAANSAVASGHRVIMASDGPLYFNAAQGDPHQEPSASRYVSTLEEVYAFSPPPKGVLGLEAAVWTENIATPDAFWYMLLPRAIALAEIASIPPEQKNWERFYRSLPGKLQWLDANGYAYRLPNVMFRLNDPHARFASVRGNINAAIVFIRRTTVTITAQPAHTSSATFLRVNRGRWTRTARLAGVPAGATVDTYSTVRGRRSAVTTLYVQRAENGTTARSKSFDAVVSP